MFSIRQVLLAITLVLPTGLLAMDSTGPAVANKAFVNEASFVEVIQTAIAADRTRAYSVVKQAIADFPDEVTRIVSSAMQAGATTEDIARQCDVDLPPDLVPELVSAAIAQNAVPEIILSQCLGIVPVEQALNVLIAAMQSADPTKIEALLAIAIDRFTNSGIDGSTVLVNSLVQGQLLVFADMPAACDADCLRPIAETLVNYLTEQDAAIDLVLSEQDAFTSDEPPFSES